MVSCRSILRRCKSRLQKRLERFVRLGLAIAIPRSAQCRGSTFRCDSAYVAIAEEFSKQRATFPSNAIALFRQNVASAIALHRSTSVAACFLCDRNKHAIKKRYILVALLYCNQRVYAASWFPDTISIHRWISALGSFSPAFNLNLCFSASRYS